MTHSPMAHQKVKAPKALTCWAIVSPKGRIVGIGRTKRYAWADVDSGITMYPYCGEKPNGYRCIKVQILPLTK